MAPCSRAEAGTIVLRSCSVYGNSALGAWSAQTTPGTHLGADNNCPGRGSLQILADGNNKAGNVAAWKTSLPTDLTLMSADVSGHDLLVSRTASEKGYQLRFAWDSGSHPISASSTSCCGGMNFGQSFSSRLTGHFFEIRVTCDKSKCLTVSGQVLDLKGIELIAKDDTPPAISHVAIGRPVADENGQWIRGTWDAAWGAQSQAGVCQTYLEIDGHVFAGQTTRQVPDTGSWTQCGSGAGTIDGSGAVTLPRIPLNTTSYANGPLTLSYYAIDAANTSTTQAETVEVDNAPVSVALSKPANPNSGQPQQIIATATAGPSGVAGITCSVDGSAPRAYTGARATLTVSGLGAHVVLCDASNHAVDSSGDVATSPVARASFAIRQPVVSLISTERLGQALRCRRTTEILRVPARWVTEHYHGHTIRVHIRAQRRRIHVVKCRPHTVVRKVVRDGHVVRVRVVALPHRVAATHEKLAYGRPALVDGWLGAPTGRAAGRQRVEILTAAANGRSRFRLAATTTTRPDGTWSIRLPAGPSRKIKAIFAGTSTLAPAESTVAHVSVRAGVHVHVAPRQTQWGSTIRISGRLEGGYIPPSGELVVLWIGWAGGRTEIGHVYTQHNGRFATRYTFLRGSGSETYRIWAASARESDYPYAPAVSRKTTIRVAS